jgi:methionyl-tRNA formyltransferase
VLYATAGSTKVAQMVRAWAPWGFRPAAVVIERRPEPSAVTRLRASIRERGVRATLSRLSRRVRWRVQDGQGAAGDGASHTAASFCSAEGIRVVVVNTLDDPQAVETVRALQPDLAIHAGAGILRAPLLAVPRLGTLNAHMGILPRYRGMNVTEWTLFEGGPVGCSVHLIEAGIDTGDILCVRTVNVRGVGSIADLRRRLDDAQVALLGEVVRFVLATGRLPARRPQQPEEGVQYFRMHPELTAFLQAELSFAD